MPVLSKSGRSKFKMREGSPNRTRKTMVKGFVKQTGFKPGVKGRGRE